MVVGAVSVLSIEPTMPLGLPWNVLVPSAALSRRTVGNDDVGRVQQQRAEGAVLSGQIYGPAKTQILLSGDLNKTAVTAVTPPRAVIEP